MDITVKKVKAKDTYSIRKEVLRKGIDLPYEFAGDLDEESIHLGAFVEGNLVGVATFMMSTNSLFKSNQYQLRGMATLPVVRGKGAGRKIIEFAIEVLKEKGIEVLWCNARKEATTFYEKLGFKVTGNLFMVEKVGPHYMMFVDL
ncbi:GNAT family N-acetyltransferase [Tenacibaculum sp. TC6]